MLEQARSAAWARTGVPPDPFDLALSVSDGCDPAALRTVIEQRLADFTRALSGLRAEMKILRPRLEPTAVAVFEHVMLRHETEIAWHRRLLEQVGRFGTRRADSPAEDQAGGRRSG